MEPAVVLRDIPFRPDPAGLIRKLRIPDQPGYIQRFRNLVAEGRAVARPKAMYRPAYIESRDTDTVVIDGIRMTSRVLRVNLEQAHRVFPYVATCGREMAAWAEGLSDLLDRFWADAIMEAALREALRVLEADIAGRFNPGPTGSMNPGSLRDWPLEQQRELFQALGDPMTTIGVELTDSFLMIPIKSVSGLRFPTEIRYENCQLCPRDRCPERRAPYDRELHVRRYGG